MKRIPQLGTPGSRMIFIPTGAGGPVGTSERGGGGVSGNYLPLSGGELTGSLILHDDPTATKEAATKHYVDANIAAGGTFVDAPSNGNLYGRKDNAWEQVPPAPSLTGLATETFVTNAISAIPPPNLTGLATETFVTNAITAIPPPDLTGLATEQFVDDAIDAIPPPDLTGLLELTGGTMTGALNLHGAPTTNLEAATKAYVDAQVAAGGTFVDAPTDGVLYGRKDGTWEEVPEGLEEAPEDGKLYGRQDGAWEEVTLATGGVEEAPEDGILYGRKDAAWEVIDEGVEEAPDDGKVYGRKNMDWEEITEPDLSSYATQSFVTNAIAAIPAPDVEEAPEDGKLYGRKDADWEEITPTDLSGHLPLTGGTITGDLTVNATDIMMSATGSVTIGGPGTTNLVGTVFVDTLTPNLISRGTFALDIQGSPVNVSSSMNLNGNPVATTNMLSNLVAEANKDGKLYGRKDGAWEEIPASVTGSYLPLSGGTMTGGIIATDAESTFGGLRSTWFAHLQGSYVSLQTGGSVIINGGSIQINGPINRALDAHGGLNAQLWVDISNGSYFQSAMGYHDLRSTSDNFNLHAPNANFINLDGNTNVGSNSAGKELRVYGDIHGNSINTTGYANISGSYVNLQSSGTVAIGSTASIQLSGETLLHGPNRLFSTTELAGRLYRNGPDGVPILDIPTGNNPHIQIGSSNFNASVGVSGDLWAQRFLGQFTSHDNSEVISAGSGISLTSQYGFYFTRTQTAQPQYAPRMNFDGSGLRVISDMGVRLYSPWGDQNTAYTRIYPGSATFGGSFLQTEGWFQANQGAQINNGLSIYGDLYLSSGNAYKPGGGSWLATSDARLKTDVEEYREGLEKLTQLKPIKFRYNERARMAETGKQYVGLAAEEAKKVMPSIVGSMKGKIDYEDKKTTDILTVDSSELIFTVINALKQIDERLGKLEGKKEAKAPEKPTVPHKPPIKMTEKKKR